MRQFTLSLLAVLLVAPAALAELASIDDPVFGPGALTRDNATGLDWLDLTVTQDQSFNQVTARLGAGGDLQGYRFATAQELFVFWENAGIDPHVGLPSETIGFVVSPEAAVRDWVALVGDTINDPFDGPGGRGIVNTPHQNGLLAYDARLDQCGALAPPGNCRGATLTSSVLVDVAGQDLGSFLVVLLSPLAQCESDLATCIATGGTDQDGDAIPDAIDLCPDTPSSTEVDSDGCSLDQFCSAIDATTRRGRRTCLRSDWQNDEPLMRRRERDCTVDRGGRGRADDRCVAR